MGKMLIHPKADDPRAMFPGVAALDRTGARLAFEMLCELEDFETTDQDGILASDRACLENWPRQGEAFRNVVLEYLHRADKAGSSAEAGFCAVLSDFVATVSIGAIFSAKRYGRMFDLESEVADGPS